MGIFRFLREMTNMIEQLCISFYPIALKGCCGIVFGIGVRMGGCSGGRAVRRQEKVCPACISETVGS